MTATDASYFDSGRELLYEGFRARLASGVVAVQRCEACSTAYFPPVLRCGTCGADSWDWTDVPGGTTIAAIRPGGAALTTVLVEVGGCRIVATTAGEAPVPGSKVALRSEADPRGRPGELVVVAHPITDAT